MVERTPILDAVTHLFLIFGIVLTCLPIYLAFVAASQTVEEVNRLPMSLLPGLELGANVAEAWSRADLGLQLWNSLVQSAGIAIGKISISFLSAFAIVYFNFPYRMAFFWLIFISLMLPVEIRIVPTYEVAANALYPLVWLGQSLGLESLLSVVLGWEVSFDVKLSLLNSYAGLIIPLIASATATFLFRQFFMTVPNELCEAAKLDGATPMQFFRHVLLPLSRTNIAALGVIMFIYGWIQFLWPLLITTQPEYTTIVIGIAKLMPGPDTLPEWNVVMAAALIAMLPPILVVVLLQRLFVKGLVETDK